MSPAMRIAQEVAGPSITIAVPLPFIQLTGDHASALVLSQLLYHQDKQEGWFAKSDEDLCRECHVTPRQLERIKRDLKPLGVRYKRQGFPARGHYTVDIAEVQTQLRRKVLSESEPELARSVETTSSRSPVPTQTGELKSNSSKRKKRINEVHTSRGNSNGSGTGISHSGAVYEEQRPSEPQPPSLHQEQDGQQLMEVAVGALLQSSPAGMRLERLLGAKGVKRYVDDIPTWLERWTEEEIAAAWKQAKRDVRPASDRDGPSSTMGLFALILNGAPGLDTSLIEEKQQPPAAPAHAWKPGDFALYGGEKKRVVALSDDGLFLDFEDGSCTLARTVRPVVPANVWNPGDQVRYGGEMRRVVGMSEDGTFIDFEDGSYALPSELSSVPVSAA